MNHSHRVDGRVLGAAVAILLFTAGCADPAALPETEEPRHTNVDSARQIWLASRPSEYTFEVAITAMAPSQGYYSVHVADGVVIAATDATGRPIANFFLTLDTLWESLLDARARGELNSAYFNEKGVPVDVNMGRWENDSGWRASVRKFTRLQ